MIKKNLKKNIPHKICIILSICFFYINYLLLNNFNLKIVNSESEKNTQLILNQTENMNNSELEELGNDKLLKLAEIQYAQGNYSQAKTSIKVLFRNKYNVSNTKIISLAMGVEDALGNFEQSKKYALQLLPMSEPNDKLILYNRLAEYSLIDDLNKSIEYMDLVINITNTNSYIEQYPGQKEKFAKDYQSYLNLKIFFEKDNKNEYYQNILKNNTFIYIPEKLKEQIQNKIK